MNVLKGDWYSDKSRVGRGQGWRCRRCGVWVSADQPLICTCSAEPLTPTVDALLAENARIKELLIEISAAHIGQNGDGAYIGPFGPRLDAEIGAGVTESVRIIKCAYDEGRECAHDCPACRFGGDGGMM